MLLFCFMHSNAPWNSVVVAEVVAFISIARYRNAARQHGVDEYIGSV